MCREKYVVVKHLLTQKKEGKNADSENFVNTMGLCYQTPTKRIIYKILILLNHAADQRAYSGYVSNLFRGKMSLHKRCVFDIQSKPSRLVDMT